MIVNVRRAVFVLATAAALLAASAAGARADAGLLANGSFEGTGTGSLASWAAVSSTLSLAADGSGGGYAARAAFLSAKSYGLRVTPFALVKASSAGATYTASGMVRSDTPGAKVCLVLFEVAASGGTQVGTAQGCVTAQSGWQPFPSVAYSAQQSGNSIGFRVLQSAGLSGQSFEVDSLSLTGAAPAQTPPAAPSGLQASAVSAGDVDLSWSASPSANVVAYDIARDGFALTTVPASTLSYADTSVHGSTSYAYAVTAVDGSGLRSQPSGVAQATTPAGGSSGLQQLPDATWMTNGRVLAMARLGNTLYIGGKFTKILDQNGVAQYAAQNLAAIDMTTGKGIPSWTPSATFASGAVAEVDALAVSSDGKRLFVGGKFDTLSGVPRKRFAALDPVTATVDPAFTAAFADGVDAILPTPGKIYVGGLFTSVNGKSRPKLAALLPSGALDPAWTPSADKAVRKLVLAPDGRTVLVAGGFGVVDGQSRQSLARVTLDTGALDAWQVPAGMIKPPMTAWDMVATSTRLYVALGAAGQYFAAFHLDSGASGAQVWRTPTVGNVQTVALSPDGKRLFVGGHFGTNIAQQTVCGNVALHGLASADPATGVILCDWAPAIVPSLNNITAAWTFLETPSQLWLGGYFTSVGGRAQKGVARWSL